MIKSFSLNQFFQKIGIKKQYVKTLKNKTLFLQDLKEQNYKNLNFILFFKDKILFLQNFLITYIINISFTRKNTWLQITNYSGKPKFLCSAGILLYNKNRKKSRVLVLKSMIHFLLQKLKFLFNKSIALHLKNVKFVKFWILKKLKKKFFIQVVKNFNLYAYNGCRKKKVRRKKFKK